jgi:antitoxin component of RelBE/YafQ-DinJ toxin-antitoxin module
VGDFQMPRTTVLSIRINKKTREILEKNAKILNLKVSVLAARVLEERTELWAKEYAARIFHELGLDENKNEEYFQ